MPTTVPLACLRPLHFLKRIKRIVEKPFETIFKANNDKFKIKKLLVSFSHIWTSKIKNNL